MNCAVGLQLYSVREYSNKDFIGTLEKVAEIGYKGVEFAGYGNLPAAKLKDCLDRLDMKVFGSHVPMEELKNNIDKVIEFNLEIGNSYIVCPYGDLKTKLDYLDAAQLFNKIGERCKKAGLEFCYHNHSHEFKVIDGKYALDILYKNTAPQFVKAEIDTYWVQYAGIDVLEYIKKYTGRCPLIHLKDMEDTKEKDFAEIGTGIMDIKNIIKTSQDGGAKYFIVEQDVCKRPAIESVKISFENLKNMDLD